MAEMQTNDDDDFVIYFLYPSTELVVYQIIIHSNDINNGSDLCNTFKDTQSAVHRTLYSFKPVFAL